jgi:hypothetical protein
MSTVRLPEDRITRLERLYKQLSGSDSLNSNLNSAYPVRSLKLTEEVTTGKDGSVSDVIVATWTAPAGNCTPAEIRVGHNGTVEYVSGSSLSCRLYGYTVGTTVSVSVAAVYTGDVFSSEVTSSITLTGDTTTPGVPTGLTVTSGFRTLTLAWTNPLDNDFSHVEIWESRTNENLETAERIAQTYGTDFVRANCGILETRWYWLRAVDNNDNKSDFIGPVSGVTQALKAEDIPDQSIRPSKFLPKLQSMLEEIKAISAANIINSVSEDENRDTAAKATQELDTKVVEGLEAEASARTQLAATVGENTAAIVAEQKARAEADSAEATAREALAVKVGQDISAAVQTEAQARASADQAEASARTQLAATVGENTAAIQTSANAIATVDGKIEATYSIGVDANGRIAGFKLGSDGETSEMVFLANAFYFANPVAGGEPIQIFAIDATGETPKLVMNGNLFVNAAKGAGGGWIVGNMISAAAQIQIGAGGQLIMGDGSIFQMGSGAVIIDSETGVLQIRDPNNLTTGNYIRVETGDITTYQYIAGAYRAMKSLRKMEVGVGNNGTTVTLPGYWPSQPKIQVSPNALQCYNASYPNQSQQLRCYADSITYNNGVVTFVPRAYLEIGAGNVYVPLPVSVINHNIYPGADGGDNIPLTVQTSSYAVPSGAKNVVVTVKVYAQQAGGATGDRVSMKNLKADVKVVFAGTTTNIGTVNIPATNYNLSTEPTSYYKTVSITLPGGYSSAQNLYVSAYLYYAGSNSEMQWIYPFAQMDRFWLRLDSFQWSLSSSTQLATGTLNYVAIAE